MKRFSASLVIREVDATTNPPEELRGDSEDTDRVTDHCW
jgi:hypothetical protein